MFSWLMHMIAHVFDPLHFLKVFSQSAGLGE